MAAIGYEPDDVHRTLRQVLVKMAEIGTDVRGIKEEDLPRIEAQVKMTNGRVTKIEYDRAVERGAALQRAATIEDVREVRASDLARNAWIKPGVLTLVAALIGAVVGHFFG